MIPGINPKKVEALMKQMGMSQEEIDASQVIIKKSDNSGKIIIDNPSVMKVKMQGQETFQISGEISETEEDTEKNEDSAEDVEKDIETIMEKTGIKNKKKIETELEKNQGDLAKTILELSK